MRIILFLIFPLVLKSQTKYVKRHIKQTIDIVKGYSLYTDSLNWKKIKNEIKVMSRDLKTVEQCTVVSTYLISELRKVCDNHSFFLNSTKAKNLDSNNTAIKQPTGRYLGDHIGYIRVPEILSMNLADCRNFADKIQTLIRSIDSLNIDGWIVDLSENKGGNMYPMIAGLGPLIGDGILGYFSGPENRVKSSWSYENGQCGYITVSDPYTIKNKNIKIAVLISNLTASSGEMTTISFFGKENIKVIGQPSGGYTTGNQGFKLSDGSCIYLATTSVSDRTHKKYVSKLLPDIQIEGDMVPQRSVVAARQWLISK